MRSQVRQCQEMIVPPSSTWSGIADSLDPLDPRILPGLDLEGWLQIQTLLI